jgi:hypothetical protein
VCLDWTATTTQIVHAFLPAFVSRSYYSTLHITVTVPLTPHRLFS